MLFRVENGRVSVDVSNADPEEVDKAGRVVDLLTALPGTNPARPDREGVIARDIAPDMQSQFRLEALLVHAGVEVEFGPSAS